MQSKVTAQKQKEEITNNKLSGRGQDLFGKAPIIQLPLEI